MRPGRERRAGRHVVSRWQFLTGFAEATIGELENRYVTYAIGLIEELLTHRIAGPALTAAAYAGGG